MKKNIIPTAILFIVLFFSACESGEKTYDASGSFEAIERVISAEATGVIEILNIQEGKIINIGDTLGYIDVSNMTLQAEQIKASIHAIGAKKGDAKPQIKVLNAQITAQESQVAILRQQMANLQKEINRFQKLVDANAAPRKQLDDLVAQKLVLQKQINGVQQQKEIITAQISSTKQTVSLQNNAVTSEEAPNQKRLELIQKQIGDGVIISQHQGTITTQISYDGEFVSIGRPLYKIANLEKIILRAYISGNQIPQVKLNQTVTIRTDDGAGEFNENKGVITWISDKAEFTPKTIQTKDERANLVYAIKVKVENDGRYKIGMYGEITF
jgi:HlyD family secretion protein